MIRPDNQCGGKIAYETLEKANAAVKNLNNRSSARRLTAYKCPHCGAAHLGHEAKGKKMQHNPNKSKHKIINYVHKPGIHRINEDED